MKTADQIECVVAADTGQIKVFRENQGRQNRDDGEHFPTR